MPLIIKLLNYAKKKKTCLITNKNKIYKIINKIIKWTIKKDINLLKQKKNKITNINKHK